MAPTRKFICRCDKVHFETTLKEYVARIPEVCAIKGVTWNIRTLFVAQKGGQMVKIHGLDKH